MFLNASTVQTPAWDQLDALTVQTCEQFTHYHLDKCVRDIVRDRRWRLKNLSQVFAGEWTQQSRRGPGWLDTRR